MLFIPYLIIAIAGGRLAWLLVKKTEPKVVMQGGTGNNEPDIEYFKNQYEQKEKELFGVISTGFNQKITEEIREGIISTGMPEEFLIMAWGKPRKKEIDTESDTYAEKWYYQPDKHDDTKFTTTVFIENHKIVGWKDV